MPAGLSATAANALITSLIGSYTWVQLHTASPGAAGTTAVAGNTTRKQVSSWGSVSAGGVVTAVDLAWTSVSTTEQYTHFTVWSASSAGTFGFSGTLTANPVTAGDNFTILSGNLGTSLTVAS
jgi:hypothetical protein